MKKLYTISIANTDGVILEYEFSADPKNAAKEITKWLSKPNTTSVLIREADEQ